MSINPKSIRILSGCGNRYAEVIKNSCSLNIRFFLQCIKKLAEFICQTENPARLHVVLTALRALEPASARFVCKLSFHPLAYSQL